MTVPDLETKISVLRRVPGMELIILFGSHAEGNATPESDLDVGVMMRSKPDLIDLTSQLIQSTGINQVDLIDLRRCDPVLGMQILTKGRVLYRKPGAFGTAGSYIARRYADTKKFREAVSRSIDHYLDRKGVV